MGAPTAQGTQGHQPGDWAGHPTSEPLVSRWAVNGTFATPWEVLWRDEGEMEPCPGVGGLLWASGPHPTASVSVCVSSCLSPGTISLPDPRTPALPPMSTKGPPPRPTSAPSSRQPLPPPLGVCLPHGPCGHQWLSAPRRDSDSFMVTNVSRRKARHQQHVHRSSTENSQ